MRPTLSNNPNSLVHAFKNFNNPRAIVCVAEAGEGGGKTSGLKLIKQQLEAKGYKVLLTREPGGSPVAEEIRNILVTGRADKLAPETELLLFAAARVEHLRSTILPAMQTHDVILIDRFVFSTVAYQSSLGVSSSEIINIHRNTTQGFAPDQVLLFDVPAEIGLARSTKRLATESSAEGRYESLELQFHKRVRASYLCMYDEQLLAPWHKLDARKPQADVVQEAVDVIVPLIEKWRQRRSRTRKARSAVL